MWESIVITLGELGIYMPSLEHIDWVQHPTTKRGEEFQTKQASCPSKQVLYKRTDISYGNIQCEAEMDIRKSGGRWFMEKLRRSKATEQISRSVDLIVYWEACQILHEATVP